MMKLFMTSLLVAAAIFSSALFAQEVVVVEVEKPVAGYDKGFFVMHGNDYALRVNGRLQTRADYIYQTPNKHDVKLTIPNARLLFSGHVFDPRIAFGTQLAFDDNAFKIIEFAANLGMNYGGTSLKIGRFPGMPTLLEATSPGKLGFTTKSFVFEYWNVGQGNGFSFHRNRKKDFGFDLTVFENGKFKEGDKRRGTVALSLSFNMNETDTADEMDLEGGPLRMIVNLGGTARAQIEGWKLLGYTGALETLIKVSNLSFGAGFLTGVTETKPLSGTGATLVHDDIKNAKLELGGYSHLGYVFDRTFGLAARYGMHGNYTGIPTRHEVLGAASIYFWDHNLKFMLEGGVNLQNKQVQPLARGQFQLAF